MATIRSQYPWAAVAVSNPKFEIISLSQLSIPHCSCAEVLAPGFMFYAVSCYFQHSDAIEKHVRHLEKILHSLRGKRRLISIDANARSSLWGPQSSDERGVQVEELIRAFDLYVVNDAAKPPTYWTTRESSFIDVTLASTEMLRFIGGWRVRPDWTTSDHNAVDICSRPPKVSKAEGCVGDRRFDTRRADWDRFAESLADHSRSRQEGLGLVSASDVEAMATELTGAIIDTCEASTPRKRRFRRSNPWWTKELTKRKKAVYRLRRGFQREREESARRQRKLKYRSSLRKYSRAVESRKLAPFCYVARKFGTLRHRVQAPGGKIPCQGYAQHTPA